jgi:uncharacterized protein YjbI with pentapeptide repeats
MAEIMWFLCGLILQIGVYKNINNIIQICDLVTCDLVTCDLVTCDLVTCDLVTCNLVTCNLVTGITIRQRIN